MAQRARWTGVALPLTIAGCTFDFDAAGPRGGATHGGAAAGGSTVSGGSADGGSMAGGAPSCDGTCVALAGFSGPFVLDDEACVAPLRGGYADVEPILEAEEATCGCGCEEPAILGCSAITLTLYDEAGCGGPTALQIGFGEGVCFSPRSAGVEAYSLSIPANGGVASAACQSNDVPAAKTAVVFLDPIDACETTAASCGDSSLCLPAEVSGLCVLGAQGAPCPEPFANSRPIVLEDELGDDRDCTCECGLLSATCTPSFDIFADTGCTEPDREVLTPSCTGPLDATRIESLTYRPASTNASCLGSNQLVVGGVAPGPSRVLCCAD